MYENLTWVLRQFEKEKILVNINTNGIMLPDVWDEYKSMVFSYTIGLNALTGEEQEKLAEFLKKAIAAKNRPRINIRFVLTNENYNNVFASYDYYKELSDNIQFQPLHSKMSGTDYHGADTGFLTYEDIEQVDVLLKQHRIKSRTLNAFISNKLDCRFTKCNAGVFTLSLDPYGNIYNCNHMKEKLGDIRGGSSFYDIFKGLKHYRERMFLSDSSGCQCFTNDRRVDWYLSRQSLKNLCD